MTDKIGGKLTKTQRTMDVMLYLTQLGVTTKEDMVKGMEEYREEGPGVEDYWTQEDTDHLNDLIGWVKEVM